MNIKKTLSKFLACSLVVVSTFTTGMLSSKANAQEVNNNKWKTLVLICPKVDIQKTPYTSAASTTMNEDEIGVVKSEASYITYKHIDYDVKVSDIPITQINISMANGRTVDVDDILDKYAPQGKYDSVLVVYRDKDGKVDLATNNTTTLPNQGHTNGAIVSTIKLDNADHKMTYYSFYNPLFLLDTLSSSLYKYFTREGFKLYEPREITPQTPINDPQIFIYTQKRIYAKFFNGESFGGYDNETGVTDQMWQHRPSANK